MQGKVFCNGQCVDPSSFTTTSNCGACGKLCEPNALCQTPVTGNSFCTPPCPPDLAACGFTTGFPTDDNEIIPICRNTKTDPEHCGGCNKRCGSGQICDNGSCKGCSSPNTFCSNLAGERYCADLGTDESNCGGCGDKCPAGEVCNGGECTDTYLVLYPDKCVILFHLVHVLVLKPRVYVEIQLPAYRYSHSITAEPVVTIATKTFLLIRMQDVVPILGRAQ